MPHEDGYALLALEAAAALSETKLDGLLAKLEGIPVSVTMETELLVTLLVADALEALETLDAAGAELLGAGGAELLDAARPDALDAGGAEVFDDDGLSVLAVLTP